MEKLNELNLGLALGVVFGMYVFFLGIAAAFFDTGTTLVQLLSIWYIGYSPTLLGSVIGGIWGFIDGVICGVLIALVYNRLQKRSEKPVKKKKR